MQVLNEKQVLSVSGAKIDQREMGILLDMIEIRNTLSGALYDAWDLMIHGAARAFRAT